MTARERAVIVASSAGLWGGVGLFERAGLVFADARDDELREALLWLYAADRAHADAFARCLAANVAIDDHPDCENTDAMRTAARVRVEALLPAGAPAARS